MKKIVVLGPKPSEDQKKENSSEKAKRIISALKRKYPGTKCFDLDGRCLHFLSEVEPTQDHPEYDRAVEVIIKSKPHKHLKMTQNYKVLSGNLNLYLDDRVVELSKGDVYTINPGTVHWAESDDECWVEIFSTPGWTAEDHVLVEAKDN